LEHLLLSVLRKEEQKWIESLASELSFLEALRPIWRKPLTWKMLVTNRFKNLLASPPARPALAELKIYEVPGICGTWAVGYVTRRNFGHSHL
jgi:hypothetical protein